MLISIYLVTRSRSHCVYTLSCYSDRLHRAQARHLGFMMQETRVFLPDRSTQVAIVVPILGAHWVYVRYTLGIQGTRAQHKAQTSDTC